MFTNDTDVISTDITRALDEDLGDGDISAQLIPEGLKIKARIISRQDAVIAGIQWAEASFLQLDPKCKIDWHCKDGQNISENESLCVIHGDARAMLSAERTAINFLQTLSAVATRTYAFVQAVAHTSATILDTRKTLPGLRRAQKYAVLCGGGKNHRIGLYDAFLIKENHISAAGSIKQALESAQRFRPTALLEVEVESLNQLKQAIASGAQRVLLDNFKLSQLTEAVAINQNQLELEASGGVNLETVSAIAETGVDYISIGSLTKDINAVDLSMRVIEDVPNIT